MNNFLFLTDKSNNMIEVLFSINKPKPFDVYSKLIFNHVEKLRENSTDVKLVLG